MYTCTYRYTHIYIGNGNSSLSATLQIYKSNFRPYHTAQTQSNTDTFLCYIASCKHGWEPIRACVILVLFYKHIYIYIVNTYIYIYIYIVNTYIDIHWYMYIFIYIYVEQMKRHVEPVKTQDQSVFYRHVLATWGSQGELITNVCCVWWCNAVSTVIWLFSLTCLMTCGTSLHRNRALATDE